MGSQIFYPVKFTGYFRTRVGDGLRQHYVAVKLSRLATGRRTMLAGSQRTGGLSQRKKSGFAERGWRIPRNGKPESAPVVYSRFNSAGEVAGAAERGGLQGESKTFGVHPELDLTDYGIHACNRGEVGKSKSKAKEKPQAGQVFSNLVAVTTNQLFIC